MQDRFGNEGLARMAYSAACAEWNLVIWELAKPSSTKAATLRSALDAVWACLGTDDELSRKQLRRSRQAIVDDFPLARENFGNLHSELVHGFDSTFAAIELCLDPTGDYHRPANEAITIAAYIAEKTWPTYAEIPDRSPLVDAVRRWQAQVHTQIFTLSLPALKAQLPALKSQARSAALETLRAFIEQRDDIPEAPQSSVQDSLF